MQEKRTIPRTCGYCGKAFLAKKSQVALGVARFCSRSCACRSLSPHGSYLSERWIAHFWSRVNANGPIPAHCPELGQCWLWTGARKSNGYGHVSANGKSISAHRASWEIMHGVAAGTLFVLHRCDNPACVRPSHLLLGTQQDNVDDMRAKNRQVQGEAAHAAKLTGREVQVIRERYAAGGASLASLGEEYGVCVDTIHKIVRRATWKHIE